MTTKTMSDEDRLALAELKIRLEAKSDVYHYMKGIMGERFVDGKHFKILSDVLNKVKRGEIKRIGITLPPRHGKSTLVSTQFPSWVLGQDHQAEFMIASYSAGLSDGISRGVKANMESDFHKRVFGTPPKIGKASGSWAMEGKHNSRPNLIATSIGGSLTGDGADYLIIDDPIRNTQDAMSDRIRDTTWEWYLLTALSRLSPQGCVILVMTRWHHDDLYGRIKKYSDTIGMDGLDAEPWTWLHMPALNEKGEALWPERWDAPTLERKRIEMGEREFTIQYQGKPTHDKGNLIKADWWNSYDYTKMNKIEGKVYTVWDTAYDTKTMNDYTVCCVFVQTAEGHYIIDRIKEKMEYPELLKKAKQIIEQYQPYLTLIEDKGSGKSLIQQLKRDTNYPIRPIIPLADKVSRVIACTSVIEGGRVYLPRDDTGRWWYWAKDLIEECAQFPAGEHDDTVDVISMYLNYVLEQNTGIQSVRVL